MAVQYVQCTSDGLVPGVARSIRAVMWTNHKTINSIYGCWSSELFIAI